MSWWIGLDRRALRTLAVRQEPTPLDRLVPMQRYRMDGTPIAEKPARPATIGQWNQTQSDTRRPRRVVS